MKRKDEGGRIKDEERIQFRSSLFLHPSSFCLVYALLAGCDRLDMYDQPRYEPLEASNFFGDGLSARPAVEGTIPRGGLRDDEGFYSGKDAGQFVSQIPEAAYRATYDRDPRHFGRPYDETEPAELRLALLTRGRERFDIYCSVCHGRTGNGRGMVVQRGFRQPPSYHIDRLRQVPAGYIYDVMTNGFGSMASYASRVGVADRWAIVAYIRALQLSQNASVDDVPADQRDELAPPDSVTRRVTRTVILADAGSAKERSDFMPEQACLGDEVVVSAPTGRDSVAQGALALGWLTNNDPKPQRGEIPASLQWISGRWNRAPSGLVGSLKSSPRADAPWAIESRPLRGWHGKDLTEAAIGCNKSVIGCPTSGNAAHLSAEEAQ